MTEGEVNQHEEKKCQHLWSHTSNILDRYEFEEPKWWYECLLCGAQCSKLPLGTYAENEISEPY